MDIATPLFLIPPSEGSKAPPWEVRSQDRLGQRRRARNCACAATSTADSTNADGKPDQRSTTEQLNVFPDDQARDLDRAGHRHPAGLYTERPRPARPISMPSNITLKSDVKARYDRTAR